MKFLLKSANSVASGIRLASGRNAKFGFLAGTALAAVFAASSASAQVGWYGAVDLGYHWSGKVDGRSSNPAANGQDYIWNFNQRHDWDAFARLGYQVTGRWRVELEGGYRPGNFSSIEGNASQAVLGLCELGSTPPACGSPSGKIEPWTVMGNVIYDILPGSPLDPFIGAGIGVNHINMDVNGQFSNVTGVITPPGGANPSVQTLDIFESDTVFAWQALAGVSWKATDQLKVDVTYRYLSGSDARFNSVGSAALQPGVFSGKYTDSSISVGLRYSFAAPPPPPPPPPPPTVPDPASAEYRRDYGLAAIQASAAFNAGGTGQGITVAVIDSGVFANPPDLAGAISPDSTDIVAGRNQPNGTDQHATFIAGIIASRFNGQGTIGVAFKSTILSVRADEAGSCANTTGPADQQGCQFDDADLGNGIDYAVAHGARIINLSVGAPDPSSRSFQNALGRAVAAGVVVTISAGNDSGANPDYPGEYAIDPRYLGSVVAVGATDKTKTLTSYSNKAGDAAAAYVVAPGDVRVTNCDGTNCWNVSGTSFSAPTVAGAIALLLQAFPNLTGQQAINILETTADDLGDPGVDPVYGHGLIDLAKAFQPMGPMSVPQSATRVSEATALAGTNMSTAFGDAFRRTQALTTIGFDSYGRRFVINLASGLPTGRPTLVSGGVTPAMQQTGMAVAGKGFAMSFTAGVAQPDSSVLRGAARLVQQRQDRTDLNLDVRAGHFSFQAWRGQNGMAPAPELAASSNAFAALAHPTQAVRAAFGLKGVTVSTEMGASSRQPLFTYASIEPSSYAMASVGLARPRWSATASFGRLDEPEGPLGSLIPGQTAFSMPAHTDFASLHADFAALPWLTLSGEGSIGRTRAESAFLSQSAPLVSSSWRLIARTECAGDGCTHFELDLSQPIRVEAGQFWTVLPDIPANYDDPLYFSRRSFSAAPGGRELDVRLGMDRSWNDFGLLQLQLVGARDAGNYAGQPLSLGLLANWRTRF